MRTLKMTFRINYTSSQETIKILHLARPLPNVCYLILCYSNRHIIIKSLNHFCVILCHIITILIWLILIYNIWIKKSSSIPEKNDVGDKTFPAQSPTEFKNTQSVQSIVGVLYSTKICIATYKRMTLRSPLQILELVYTAEVYQMQM